MEPRFYALSEELQSSRFSQPRLPRTVAAPSSGDYGAPALAPACSPCPSPPSPPAPTSRILPRRASEAGAPSPGAATLYSQVRQVRRLRRPRGGQGGGSCGGRWGGAACGGGRQVRLTAPSTRACVIENTKDADVLGRPLLCLCGSAACHRIWRARFGSRGRRAPISSTLEACELSYDSHWAYVLLLL